MLKAVVDRMSGQWRSADQIKCGSLPRDLGGKVSSRVEICATLIIFFVAGRDGPGFA
jgi:hypothetical protein